MMDALKSHWPEYLIEGACLALFMVSAFYLRYDPRTSRFAGSPGDSQSAAAAFFDGIGDGRHRDRDHLFTVGKTVRCSHQSVDHDYLL